MTLNEFLLFLHILGAMIWVGGSVMLQVMGIQARTAGPERMTAFLGGVGKIANAVLIPASLTVVTAGVLMVLRISGYSFSQPWIAAALALFVASFLTGAIFIGPETGRIFALVEERGPSDDEVQRRTRRIFLVSRIELVALIVIVLLMVTKPGL